MDNYKYHKIHQQITQTITKTEEDQYRNRLLETLDILTEIYTTIPTLQNPPITYIFDIETQNNNTLQDTIKIYENLLHYIELPTLQDHTTNKEYHKIHDTLNEIHDTIRYYKEDIQTIQNTQQQLQQQ